MKNKMQINQIIYFCTILAIMFLPKINLITISGTTTGIRIDDFLIAISIIMYIIKKKNSNEKLLHNNKFMRIFWIYIIVCVASTILGYAKGYISILLGIIYCMRKIEYFLLFFIGYDYSISAKNMIRLFDFSVIFNFIIVLLQKFKILGSFSQVSVGTIMEGRYSSVFTGSYELTAFLLLLLPFFYSKYDKSNKNVLMIILIFTILLLSESRTSVVLFGIVMLIIFLKEKKKTKLTILSIYSIIAFALLYLIISNNEISFLPRMEDLNFENIKNSISYSWNNRSIYNYINNYKLLQYYNIGDLSFNIRIKNWMSLIDGFLKNPIFGMGMSIVKNASDGGYIRLLAETGLAGLITWMACIRNIFKSLKDNLFSKCMEYSIITLIIGAIFIDLFDASKVMCMFWLLVGFSYKIKVEEKI